jgi:hypothetical protein
MKPSTRTHPVWQSRQPDYYEEGRLFEQFVIHLFNEDNFKLDKWRKSEKLEERALLEDCNNPDLELVFGRYRKYRFAVECKWRKRFVRGKITWAEDFQIWSYLAFQNQFQMPVFIAIGIGGEPSNPEKLFVTPLGNIEMYQEVYEFDLIPYRKRPASKFFYDIVQGRLF